MVTRALQPWYRADVTLKLRTAPYTTKTLKLISKPAESESATYYPILQDLSGCSVNMGQDFMPKWDSGSITLDDSLGSFGFQRRFSDLLDRYTLTEQPVVLYACATTISDTAPDADFVELWRGVAKSASRSFGDNPTLTISCEAAGIDQRLITKTITADMAPTGFLVPEQSLGKVLPVVFGINKTVPLYPIQDSETDRRDGRYAIAAEFGSQFTYPAYTLSVTDYIHYLASNPIYAKTQDGRYREVVCLEGVTSYDNYSTLWNGLTPDAYPTSWGLTEFICPIGMVPSIVTGATWLCRGQNNGGITPVGEIICNLYWFELSSGRLAIDAPVRTTSVQKSAYLSQVRGASDFTVDFVFDEPFIFGGKYADGSSGWMIPAIGIVLSNYSGSATTDFCSGKVDTGITPAYAQRAASGGLYTWTTGAACPLVSCKRASITQGHAAADRDGKSYYYIDLTGISGVGTKPDLSALSMCMTLSTGLRDNSAGDITGTPYEYLSRPDWAAKLLSYRWNGSAWADPLTFDWATFGDRYTATRSGSFQRSFSGITNGETTLETFLAQMAKEMCAYIIPLKNGKLALWPWGYQSAVSRVFSDEDIKITGFEIYDPSSIVNECVVAYGDDFLNTLDQWAASSKYANKAGSVALNKDTSAYFAALLSASVSLYGARPLESSDFGLIPDAATAQTYAECMFRTHDHPWHVVKGEVATYKAHTLELLSVCELLVTQLPSFFGVSPEAPLPASNGVEVDLWRGQAPKRAKRYRAQLIGEAPKMSATEAPMLELSFRLLDIHANDPT